MVRSDPNAQWRLSALKPLKNTSQTDLRSFQYEMLLALHVCSNMENTIYLSIYSNIITKACYSAA